ncbi:MAG: phosphoenolpyruvate carboxylase [Hyphomonadaceae bacterium]
MTTPDSADPASLHAWCLGQLATLAAARRRDPLASDIRTLTVNLLERVESGELDIAALRGLVKRISDEGARRRAAKLAAANPAGDWRSLVNWALGALSEAPFEDLKQRLERPLVGAVFTGHPTFSLSRPMRAALGALASGETVDLAAISHPPEAAITLSEEHADASAAIARAQVSLRGLTAAIFDWLEQHADGPWHRLRPAPLRLSTWVGYDLDGRTDIHWSQTIRFRLEEKAVQLKRYGEALAALGARGQKLAERLARAAADAETQAERFAGDLEDPDRIVAAANRLTDGSPDRLVSLAEPLAEMDAWIEAEKDAAQRKQLCVLRTEMQTFGLGAAGIHVRVNASQVRGAVQDDLGLSALSDFFDRRAMTAAAQRAAHVRRSAVNFGSIFQETKTARRQLMLCSEILKHIDADAPIRFLIAEIESPATIMGAIYLARLYGVDDHLDIAPLFETPDVLERAGRFMERLLDEPEYLAYVRRRGRLCVQLGFSDSGRFMGQIAADLAIERAHVLLSRAMAARGVKDVEVVLFNTHGESMGRGGYPGGMNERLDHLLTPWTRARYAHDGIAIYAEMSFQGGDGYLHFETPALADAAIRGVFAWAFKRPQKIKDAFYDDINFSWDIYRGVKSWQEALFADTHYQAVLRSFPANMLPITGSRRVHRQSGTSADDAARSMRAIPHNAILQQLAVPANVSGGLGYVAVREPERFVARVEYSERLLRLVRMAHAARRLTSIATLRTYADLYSPDFWTVRAARDEDDQSSDVSLRIAERLDHRGLDVSIDRLANRLSGDRRRFDAVSRGFLPPSVGDRAFDADLYVLHAVRFVCIVRGFMLAAMTPPFSPRHDLTREDLIDQALDLRFADVSDALAAIFPASTAPPTAFDALAEQADAPGPHAGYAHINRELAEPLRAIDAAIKEITVGITHFYGAFG